MVVRICPFQRAALLIPFKDPGPYIKQITGGGKARLGTDAVNPLGLARALQNPLQAVVVMDNMRFIFSPYTFAILINILRRIIKVGW